MALKFIELLTILQLITIRNNSDGKNSKPQAIKRLVKYFLVFYTRLESSAHNFCIKNNTLRPLVQERLCTSDVNQPLAFKQT